MSPARTELLEAHPYIAPGATDRSINVELVSTFPRQVTRAWWGLFLLSLFGTGLLVLGITVTLAKGIGAWGNNVPVGWAFGIIHLVWWIGIGHAGTLISAILLLFQQRWRTSINRFAEAMTLFAVMCAALFPVLHLGRPWFAYWAMPYPSTLAVWPQFKSALTWDVFAIATYFITSLLFWYLGLIPDLAALRDTATKRAHRIVYGIFALGWRGSGRHWADWKIGYLLLAGISTPLVLSVHSVISFDFATSVIPGWHATIFPPYFVAGAVFQGMAMVLTVLVPARKYFGLENVITPRHLDNMAKLTLATGLMVSYGYLCEHFIAWYSGSAYERAIFFNRMTGFYAPVYWLMLFCNVVVPQVFWWRRARTSPVALVVACILVNVGMWCERFVIIVTSLAHDFIPSSWAVYLPTWVDVCIFVGTLGFFFMMTLLFLRFVPSVAASEVKELNHELQHGARATAAEAPQ